MDRLQEIKCSLDQGNLKFEDMKFLIQMIDSKNYEIKDYEQSLTRVRKENKELQALLRADI